MRYYLRLMQSFIRQSFQQEAAFRFNFLMRCLQTVLGLVGALGGVLIVFNQKQVLNGWNQPETIVLMGVYLTVQAVKNITIGPSLDSLAGLGGDIWRGSFDYILLKPIPTQFYTSFRKWRLWSVVDILVGLGVILVALIQHQGEVGIKHLLSFIIALVISLIIIYSILLILSSVAFWYLGTPLMWIFNSIIQMGRYPVGIYPGFLKIFLTWIIPIGFVVTVPAELLTGKGVGSQMLSGTVLAVGLFVGASFFFKASINRYSSASS